MRIAHVTATFPPYRGGTGNVCYQNARELARRGHEVHVFTAAYGDAPAQEQRDEIAIHRLRPLYRVGNAPVLPSLLWRLRGFDIIHLHYPFFGGELSALAARLSRTPLVITYHQDVLLSGALGLIERGLRRTIGRATLRSANRVFFTSHDYARASYAAPLLRGREGRIAALPNGVDVQRFRPELPTDELQARYRLGPDDHLALLVAGLDRAHAFKGVPVFLAALARLPDSVKGMIAGDGDLRADYMAQATRLGLGERVIFAGRLSERELPQHYALASVAVLPSTTMGEAFGLTLLEALACATPVVASRLPGVRTVVDERQDGLLVAPGSEHELAEALRAILSDEGVRRAMGQRGHAKVVERYDWRLIGAQLEQSYRQLAAATAGASRTRGGP